MKPLIPWMPPKWLFAMGGGGESIMADFVRGPSDGVSTDNALVRWDGTTGRLVQNSGTTLSDTGALALPVGGSVELANLAGAVNFERVRLSQAANVFTLYSENGGSGTLREFRMGYSAAYISVGGGGSGTYTLGGGNPRFFCPSGAGLQTYGNITSAAASASTIPFLAGNLQSLSGNNVAQEVARIEATMNQTGTSSYKALRVVITETGTGSGQKDLLSLETGAGTRFRVDNSGAIVGAAGASLGGAVTALNTTAIPAGGAAGNGYRFSSTTNFGVFFGSGVPTLSAAKGSLYLRSDGSGTTDRAYINTDGGTTWTAITTAA